MTWLVTSFLRLLFPAHESHIPMMKVPSPLLHTVKSNVRKLEQTIAGRPF
jgi:hypothetical protein